MIKLTSLISEGTKSHVDAAIKKVKKGGGNEINLSNSCGLTDLADHLDTYSSGPEIIYNAKTLTLFKRFVDSMASDEIENNQG